MTEPAQPGHPGLRPADVIARGGWHPSYVRVLAAASDGDHGFAHRQYEVPVSQHGLWAFVKVATDPASCGVPTLAG